MDDQTQSLPRPKCPNCDFVGVPGARFCSRCGQRLDADAVADATGALHDLPGQARGPQTGPLPVIGEQPESGAVLVTHRPNQYEGRKYVLDQDLISLGRSPDSTIFLDDVTVSRNHAELLHGSEGWLIRDLSSLNGTYVNRDRVEQTRLVNGDEVQIGKFRFIFWAAS